MSCCPNGVYRPLIRDCNGDIRNLAKDETLRIGEDLVPQEVLTEDLTIYMDPDGSDTSGEGTSSKPFKTIHRAHEEVIKYNPGNYQITIQLGYGIHYHSEGFAPSWIWGGKVIINGHKDTVANGANPASISNIDATQSTDGDYPELQYFDCDIDLSTYSPTTEVGYFIAIREVSGGTYPESLLGLHKIIAWNSGTEVATIRVWQRLGVTQIASGSITATDAQIIQSVFTFNDDVEAHAVTANGSHAGNWKDLVVEGNKTQYESYRAFLVMSGGAMATYYGYACLHNWSWGVYIYGATASNQSTHFSKIKSNGIVVSGGFTSMGYTTIINGCGGRAFWVIGGGIIDAWDIIVVASSYSYACYAEGGSFVNFEGAEFYYEHPTGGVACVIATKMSRLYCVSASYTGFTTERATSTGGETYPVP